MTAIETLQSSDTWTKAILGLLLSAIFGERLKQGVLKAVSPISSKIKEIAERQSREENNLADFLASDPVLLQIEWNRCVIQLVGATALLLIFMLFPAAILGIQYLATLSSSWTGPPTSGKFTYYLVYTIILASGVTANLTAWRTRKSLRVARLAKTKYLQRRNEAASTGPSKRGPK